MILRTRNIQSLMPAGRQGSFKGQHPLPAWSSKAGEMDSESLDTPAQSLSVSGLSLCRGIAHAVEALEMYNRLQAAWAFLLPPWCCQHVCFWAGGPGTYRCR